MTDGAVKACNGFYKYVWHRVKPVGAWRRASSRSSLPARLGPLEYYL